MNRPSFVIVRLDRAHDRTGFSCGVAALDSYFRRQAGQDMRRRVATCFVALDTASNAVAGYFTLAATSLLLAGLPAEVASRLPRYPVVPAVLLGRLAVASDRRGQKLGAALLADAISRVMQADIAAFALVMDPKDEPAGDFYRHHGFLALHDEGGRLFLPLGTLRGVAGGQDQPGDCASIG